MVRKKAHTPEEIVAKLRQAGNEWLKEMSTNHPAVAADAPRAGSEKGRVSYLDVGSVGDPDLVNPPEHDASAAGYRARAQKRRRPLALCERACRPNTVLRGIPQGVHRSVPGTAITLNTPVEEVMRRFPATVRVFTRHRMLCVGCAIGPFHTVLDASDEYKLGATTLLRELREAAAGRYAPAEPSGA